MGFVVAGIVREFHNQITIWRIFQLTCSINSIFILFYFLAGPLHFGSNECNATMSSTVKWVQRKAIVWFCHLPGEMRRIAGGECSMRWKEQCAQSA